MRMAYKESEKVFRLGEMRFASAFTVVDDQTGSILGTTVATMGQGNPDSWHAYLTGDGGGTFHPAGWQFREFPFPPSLVQSVDDRTVEPTRHESQICGGPSKSGTNWSTRSKDLLRT
jgi:hypothetical protein